jgi:hypothetical protein
MPNEIIHTSVVILIIAMYALSLFLLVNWLDQEKNKKIKEEPTIAIRRSVRNTIRDPIGKPVFGRFY